MTEQDVEIMTADVQQERLKATFVSLNYAPLLCYLPVFEAQRFQPCPNAIDWKTISGRSF
jgi:hypothetical protein